VSIRKTHSWRLIEVYPVCRARRHYWNYVHRYPVHFPTPEGALGDAVDSLVWYFVRRSWNQPD